VPEHTKELAFERVEVFRSSQSGSLFAMAIQYLIETLERA